MSKMEEIKKLYSKANTALAKLIESKAMSDLGAALVIARTTQKTLKEGVEEVVKVELIKVIKACGIKDPTKASTVYTAGSWKFSMYPREGLDPKKVLARVIAKKGPDSPQDYMRMVPTYEIPPEGSTEDKKLRKLFTVEELKEMEDDESWTLKTPTEEGS